MFITSKDAETLPNQTNSFVLIGDIIGINPLGILLFLLHKTLLLVDPQTKILS